jgi:hypothetical protein
MATMQIKGLPNDVRRILQARAASAGVSLTGYAHNTLERAARRPSRVELVAELSLIEPIDFGESSEEALRHIRDDVTRSRLVAQIKRSRPSVDADVADRIRKERLGEDM